MNITKEITSMESLFKSYGMVKYYGIYAIVKRCLEEFSIDFLFEIVDEDKIADKHSQTKGEQYGLL